MGNLFSGTLCGQLPVSQKERWNVSLTSKQCCRDVPEPEAGGTRTRPVLTSPLLPIPHPESRRVTQGPDTHVPGKHNDTGFSMESRQLPDICRSDSYGRRNQARVLEPPFESVMSPWSTWWALLSWWGVSGREHSHLHETSLNLWLSTGHLLLVVGHSCSTSHLSKPTRVFLMLSNGSVLFSIFLPPKPRST